MKVLATLALVLATSAAFLTPAPVRRSLVVRDGLWDSFKDSMEARPAASPPKRGRAISVSCVSWLCRAITRAKTAPTPGRKPMTRRRRPRRERRLRRARRRGSRSWRTPSGRATRRRTLRPRRPRRRLRRRPRRRRRRLRRFFRTSNRRNCPKSRRRGTSSGHVMGLLRAYCASGSEPLQLGRADAALPGQDCAGRAISSRKCLGSFS